MVTQFGPHDRRATLAGFGFPKDFYPAGRLDHDSEGLLLLTSDGRLQHRLTDPKFAHPRTYLVQVERVPSGENLLKLAGGLRLRDGPTRPCRVRPLPQDPALPPREPPIRVRRTVSCAWLELTLTEGRNRQVRRMTAAIGHPTLRLVRSKIGDLTLKDLPPGRWRWLSEAELRRIETSWTVSPSSPL